MMMHNFLDIMKKVLVKEMRYAVPRMGKVLNIQDPNRKGRVLVAIPALGMITADQSPWCFIADKRSYIVPAVDDYVLVSWIDAKPEFPVVMGVMNEMKDMIPAAYTGIPSMNVLFQDSKKKIAMTYDQDADILQIGKSGFVESARKNDAVKSTMADDVTFWTWLAAAAVVLAGLGVVVPAPTELNGKITAGSSQVRVGDR